MKKILLVFGTRPEAIKMAPLVKEFKKNSNLFETKICVTAQHREMLDQVLNFFELQPDYDLNLMKPDQNLHSLTSLIIEELRQVIDDFCPDFMFVHGDTTTTMASSLSAFYSNISVCHVEAGLRTNKKYSPFPEEINRQITSRISSYHFAPTQTSKDNLIKENISKETIVVTGNTVIDALFFSLNKIKEFSSDNVRFINSNIKDYNDIILVTAHRRENHGDGFERICSAIKKIASTEPNIIIVYPVHLNPNVKNPVTKYLSKTENILLVDPLSYPEFIWLMNRSKLVLTDSGGLQEEAPSIGKPVLLMRETTERPEAINSGNVILVGTDKELIINETKALLNNDEKYKQMSELKNPYGDGNASKKIVDFIKKIDDV